MQQLARPISLTEQLSIRRLLTGRNEVVDGAVPIAVFVELRGVGVKMVARGAVEVMRVW